MHVNLQRSETINQSMEISIGLFVVAVADTHLDGEHRKKGVWVSIQNLRKVTPRTPCPAVLRAAACNWASGMKGSKHTQAISQCCLPPHISFILFSFVNSLDMEGI